jgi:hypothetical protein
MLDLTRIIFEGQHQKIQKDLVDLKLDHFMATKNKRSMMLSSNNKLNQELTSATLGRIV